jgi:hypothetical protein
MTLKCLTPFAFLALAGCSAAAADPQDSYARATECEIATGVLAAFHRRISPDQRERYRVGLLRYTATARQLGLELGKDLEQMERDKRTLLTRHAGELGGALRQQALDDLIETADGCVAVE